jgi:hypothetical protein
MIKSISILFPIMILLTACQSVYKSEDQSPYAPREYFRAIEVEPLGAALMKEHSPNSSIETIQKMLKNESAINDVIILSRDNQTVVALKPFAYKRRDVDSLLSKYRDLLKAEGVAAVFLTEPNHYRNAKKMKEENEVSNEEWEATWGSYFEGK